MIGKYYTNTTKLNNKTILAVLERDGVACVVCGEDVSLHIHHILPRKFGGGNKIENLVTLCSKCHPDIENENIKRVIVRALTKSKLLRLNKKKGKHVCGWCGESVKSMVDLKLHALSEHSKVHYGNSINKKSPHRSIEFKPKPKFSGIFVRKIKQ